MSCLIRDLNSCLKRIACANPYGFEVKNERISLINQYHMYCDQNFRTISVFLINLFGGVCILVTSYLTDRLGRKIFMIIIVISGIIGSILLLSQSGLFVSALGVAMGNLLNDFMLLLGFTYYAEVSTRDSQNLANVFMFLSIAFGSLVCLTIASFTPGFTVIDAVVLFLLFPMLLLSVAMRESLYYLYNNKAKKPFFNTLSLMAEINEVNLKDIIAKFSPQMGPGNADAELRLKSNFQRNPKYSYRDFSMDLNEYSMRATDYRKDNFFESYSRDPHYSGQHSSEMNINSHSGHAKQRENPFDYNLGQNQNITSLQNHAPSSPYAIRGLRNANPF